MYNCTVEKKANISQQQMNQLSPTTLTIDGVEPYKLRKRGKKLERKPDMTIRNMPWLSRHYCNVESSIRRGCRVTLFS